MSKYIYGVFDVHPEDVVQPDWLNNLPDKTGAPVRYFDSVEGVKQAVIDCSKGDWTFNTPFGPEQQCLKISSVGVVYSIEASEELIEYVERQRKQTANASYLFTSQLPAEAIADVLAILPEDVLHDMKFVELKDAPQEMRQRKANMASLDALINASSQEQRVALDMRLARLRTAMQMIYGDNGMLTHPDMNNQMAYFYNILKAIFESGFANIEYALQVPYLYSVYESTFLDGKKPEFMLRQYRAAKCTLDELAKIADNQGDFKMRSMLYSMQNKVNKELAQLEQPATNT